MTRARVRMKMAGVVIAAAITLTAGANLFQGKRHSAGHWFHGRKRSGRSPKYEETIDETARPEIVMRLRAIGQYMWKHGLHMDRSKREEAMTAVRTLYVMIVDALRESGLAVPPVPPVPQPARSAYEIRSRLHEIARMGPDMLRAAAEYAHVVYATLEYPPRKREPGGDRPPLRRRMNA